MKGYIFFIILAVLLVAGFFIYRKARSWTSASRMYSIDVNAKMYGKDEYMHISRYNPDLTHRRAVFRLGSLVYDEKSQVYTEEEKLNHTEKAIFSEYSDLIFYLGENQPKIISVSLRPFSATRQESLITVGQAPARVLASIDSGSSFIISRAGAESLTIRIESRSGF